VVEARTAERPPGGLLGRWVVANALGELIGLGGVGLLATALVPTVQRVVPAGAARPLVTAILLVALGSFEGWVVGTAQALALAGTGVDARAWVRATVLGAVLAWAVGMVPSTVIALLGHSGDAAPGAGPTLALRLVLAAGLGVVAGPLLAAVQVPVLRRYAPRAWRWLLANALGWAAGMPLVFAAVRNVAVHLREPGAIALSLAALAFAGGLVGLVEGLFLVRLLRPAEPVRTPANI
jgi:hypothetical protein